MSLALLSRLSRHLRRAVPLSSLIRAPLTNPSKPRCLFQTAGFKSSAPLSNYYPETTNTNNSISPDDILFEGCDYKHWLITMDFPRDPKPSPEEMVETYVQTCAKVLGSVEEAKRRIYACSTTTYNGFQVEVDEETSEKFRGLPGVVFILPDSYLYPETKEYGGDKYENGVITLRPPPIQYGTQNRRTGRNRFDQNQNRPFNNQQDNFQNYPPNNNQNFQNRPPNQQGDFQNQNRSFNRQQDNFQNYPPNQQQGNNFQNHPSNQQGNFQNRPPNQQGNNYQNYPPTQQQGNNYANYPYGQTPQRGRDYNQGQGGNFAPKEQGNFSQGQDGAWKERQ